MTVAIPQVSNTNTFYFWKSQSNLLANAMSTVAVTTNSNTAVGNAAITGTFTANSFVAPNLTISGPSNLRSIIANGSIGSSGQVLTSNADGLYWSSVVGTITEVNTSGGVKGGPITTTGSVSLDLYTGSDALNTVYPIGTILSVYTGTVTRAVATESTIYTTNLNGIAGTGGSILAGTWRNRGLCGINPISAGQNGYFYLYQRVA